MRSDFNSQKIVKIPEITKSKCVAEVFDEGEDLSCAAPDDENVININEYNE